MHAKKVVLGGTFDRLHEGHHVHLQSAFEAGDHVTIGLTTEVMTGHKTLFELIEPYERREHALRAHIQKHWPNTPFSIIPIQDMFGPTVTDPSFEAIAVTPDTKKNGLKVIETRFERGLSKMYLVEAPLVPALDGGALSSSRIRLGQIDRQGRPYNAIFGHSLTVPEEQRDALRHPIGMTTGTSNDMNATASKAVAHIESIKPTLVITVGDIVTSTLIQTGLHPNISFIDLKTDGTSLPDIPAPDYYDVINPAGTIQKESAQLVEKTIDESLNKMTSKVILVDGEEDLLALPVILLAPLNAVVIYGQKDHGIVINKVTEELKDQVRNLVSLFKPL